MVTVGIICEYNPFHKGHRRQIEKIRAGFAGKGLSEEVTVVALMSGNYVQRGDFALLPKGYRAEAAILGGADLVLELPYPWSGSSAPCFARAGVSILSALSVNYLAFGSESGREEELFRMAENFSSPAFEEAFAARLAHAAKNRSYASLREEVYRELYGSIPLGGANDILGAAYLAALKEEKSALKPLVLLREGSETATASRKACLSGNLDELSCLVPEDSCRVLTENKPVTMKSLEKAFLAFWRLYREGEPVADLPLDLARRIADAAGESRSLEELFSLAATKKYTNARIRRGLLSGILGVTSKLLRERPAFTRLLGANARGRAFLAGLGRQKEATPFPILTRAGDYRTYDEKVERQVLFSDRADRFYALADENLPLNRPFVL